MPEKLKKVLPPEEEQKGEARAEYGAQIIAQLAEQLTHQYGKGFI